MDMKNIIHKLPVTRKDSAVFDISLTDWGEEVNAGVSKERKSGIQEQTAGLLSTTSVQESSKEQQHNSKQQCVFQKASWSPLAVHQRQYQENLVGKSKNEQCYTSDHVSGCFRTVKEQIPCLTSHFMIPLSDQYYEESITKKNLNSSVNVKNDILRPLCPYAEYYPARQSTKFPYLCSSDEASFLNKNVGTKYTFMEKYERSNSKPKNSHGFQKIKISSGLLKNKSKQGLQEDKTTRIFNKAKNSPGFSQTQHCIGFPGTGTEQDVHKLKKNQGYQDTENILSFQNTKNDLCFQDTKNYVRLSGKSVTWTETGMYVLSTVVVALALFVTHLHIRVHALEISNGMMHRTRCHCHGPNQEFMADYENTKLSTKNVQTRDVQVLTDDNLNENVYTGDEDLLTDGDDILTDDKDIDTDFEAALYRFQNLNSQKDIREFSKRSLQNSNYLSNPESSSWWHALLPRSSSKSIILQGDETEVKPVSSNTGELKTSDDNFRVEQTILSRPVRSSKTRKNKRLMEEILSKGYKKQYQTFVGNFYDIFHYKEDFMDHHILSHKDWGPDIQARRDSTISFTNTNTKLPFYMEVKNSTTNKKHNKKLVDTKSDELGVFSVRQQGEYLISVNITIVDITGTHFLALHLNDQAMLACANGGFRCPHVNQENSQKYRTCNIIGVLTLHKNDTLDVRTMEKNMMIRLEERRKSFFKIVLLN